MVRGIRDLEGYKRQITTRGIGNNVQAHMKPGWLRKCVICVWNHYDFTKKVEDCFTGSGLEMCFTEGIRHRGGNALG